MSTKTFPSTGNETSSKEDVLNLLGGGKAAPKQDQKPAQPEKPGKEASSKDDVMDLLSGTVKKKDTGSGSSSGFSPSQSQSPVDEAAAGKAYESKNLTQKDFDILSNSDWGKKNGLSTIPKSLQPAFIGAHNGTTKKDLMDNVVKNVLDPFFPKSDNPQQNKIRTQILQNVVMGNQDDILKVKNGVLQSIDKQISEITKQATPAGAYYGMKPVFNEAQQAKIDQLNAQAKSVKNTMDEWGVNALVNSADIKTWVDFDANHPTIMTSVAAPRLGAEIKKRYPDLYSNTSGNENYELSKLGMAEIIRNKKMEANAALKAGLLNKNPEAIKAAQKNLSDVSRYTDWYNKLDTDQHPDVGISNTMRFLGDIISENKPSKVLNSVGIITSDDVKKAAEIADKENPGWLAKYGKFLTTVEQNPQNLPTPGFMGAVERASASAFNDASFGSYNAELDRAPGMKGTSASGTSPTSISYDKEGKAYRELPNEHYGKLDWNNAYRFLGESLPGLAAWMIPEEGAMAAATKLGAAEKTAKGIGLLTASTITGFNNNRKLADELIDDNSGMGDAKKNLMAAFLTTTMAASFHLLGTSPSQAAQNAISKSVAPELLKMMEENGFEKMTEKQAKSFMKDNLLPRVKAMASKAAENVKAGVTVGTASVLDQKIKDLVSVLVNPDKAQISSIDDNIKQIGSQALLMSAIGSVGMAREGIIPPSAKDNFYEVGMRSPQYIEEINKMVESGQLDQDKANRAISLAKTAAEEVAKAQYQLNDQGLKLTVKQKKELVANNIRKRMAAGLEEAGENVPRGTIESEVDKANKEILKENLHQPIEETDTFKSIQSVDGERPKAVEDIDPAGKYKYMKDGAEVETSGAELFYHLENGDIYDKKINEGAEGKDAEGQDTKGQPKELSEAEKAKAVDVITAASDKLGTLKDGALANPGQFLKEVSEQAASTHADGSSSDLPSAEKAMREQYGDPIVDLAKELFPINKTKTESNENNKSAEQEGGEGRQEEGGQGRKQQVGEEKNNKGNVAGEGAGNETAPSFFENPPSKEKIGFDEFREQSLNDLVNMKHSEFDWRLDNKELSQAKREKGVADIRAGKDSPAAQEVEAFIKKMHDDGIVPMNRGRGKQAQSRDFTFEELGLIKEKAPEMEANINNWLNDKGELDPSQEKIIGDFIDDLIQQYGPETKTEDKQPAAGAEGGSGKETGPDSGAGRGVETKTPEESAAALRGSADRIRAEDPEGAKLLDQAADRIDAGKPPPKGPEAEAARKEPDDTVSITNAAVNESRLLAGLRPVLKEAKRKFGQTWKDAISKVKAGTDPRAFVADLAADIKNVPTRAFSDVDNAVILMDRIDLTNQKRMALTDLDKARNSSNENIEALAWQQLSHIEQQIQQNDLVADKVGTAQGRALSSRRLLANMDYSLAAMKRDIAKYYPDKNIPPEVLARLEKIETEHAEAVKKLAEYEEKWKDQQGKSTFKKAVDKAKKEKPDQKTITEKGKALADKIRALRPKTDSAQANIFGLPVAIYDTALVTVANAVESGAKLADAIKEGVKYIKENNPFATDKDEKDFIAHLKGLDAVPLKERMTEKISELAKNAGAESITKEMITPLRKLINDYARNGEEDFGKVVNDVFNELKDKFTNLTKEDIRDAYSGYGNVKLESKTELAKKVADWKKEAKLLAQMDDVLSGKSPSKGERTAPGEDSPKIAAMRKELEQKMKEQGISWTNPPKSIEEKNARALQSFKTRLQNEIDHLTAAIENKKDIPKGERTPLDAEAKALLNQRDELKDLLDHVLGKEGKKTLTDAQRIERAEKALDKQIDGLAKDIKDIQEGNYQADEKKKQPNSISMELLRGRRDALRELKNKLLIDHSPESSEPAIALEKYKDNIRNRLMDYSRRIDEGDFEDKEDKKAFQNDAEAAKLEAELKRAQTAFRQEKVQAEKANRTTLKKVLDKINTWKRFSVLTGIPTLGKLTTAVTYRTIFNPIEELTGSVLKYTVPSAYQLSRIAPREGGGFNFKAEGSALKEWARAKTWKDAMKVIKDGQSELDERFGKYVTMPPEALEVMGRIHASFKNFAKRSEFARAYEQRMDHAIKHGGDPSDELTQLTAMSGAYIDANRNIFMQDNFIVNIFNKAIQAGEQSKNPNAQVAAALTRFLLPIVKIPTNFVRESLNYSFGSARVVELFARGLTGHINDMTPEAADSLMRSLKKGTVGAAAMAIGFYIPGIAGGYYQRGKQPQEGEAGWDQIKIGDVTIPTWATHFPLFEAMEIGATMRKVMDRDIEKGKGDDAALFDGIGKSARGLVGEIPLFRFPEEVNQTFTSGDPLNDILYPELGSNIPIAIQWAAGKMDTPNGFDLFGDPIKRKPEGALQQLEYRTPGLRDEVPTKAEQDAIKAAGGN